MIAAGSYPAARYVFFDRLTESEGKTGNWFSELFGTTRPAQKRLREMIRGMEQLPPSCRDGRSAKATEDFLKWQASVVSLRERNRKEELPGLVWKKEVTPKLRSDVSHFAFSHDGRFLLAQDDFSVTVIQREPLEVLFQIPVEYARQASFSPDGQYVVFTTGDLRYEKWSVAERKPVEVRELVIRRDCWEHKLSPDGNYLACVDTSAAVNVLDTRTGKKVWEKKQFYQLTRGEYFSWLLSSKAEGDSDINFFRIEFSPDSKFVMFSRSNKFRYDYRSNGLTYGGSENAALALDLTTLRPAGLGGDLKKISSRPYLFLDSNRVLGMPSNKVEDTGIFSFPDGKRLRKFDFGAKEIKRTANPDYVVIKPLANAKMGVFDLKKGVLASGFNKKDGTFWNNLMAYESVSGQVLIREVVHNEAEQKFDSKAAHTVEIPVGSIINLESAAVSDGFDWLLLSSKTRGGLWNLETGERKFYVRGFSGGLVAKDGTSVADFPKLDDAPHSLVLLNPNTNKIGAIRELPERGARQYGGFVLLRRSLKTDKAEQQAGEESNGDDLSEAVRFELKDLVQDKIVWSRDFPKESPEFSFDKGSGRLIFYWGLGSEEGKARLKELPQLEARARELGNKIDDYLVEIIDAAAQKTAGAILLETGNGSFDVGGGASAWNWLVIRDSTGRVLVYSIKDGDLRHRFFGGITAINPGKNQIALQNLPGEISIYNLDTGDQQARIAINGRDVFLKFNPEGNRLFVLSDTQSAYAFDLNKIEARPAAQSK